MIDRRSLLRCYSGIVVRILLGVFDLFIRQLHIVDNYVNAFYVQASHALNRVDDIAADSFCEFVDSNAVFGDDCYLDGGNTFCNSDGNALTYVFITTERFANGANQACTATAESRNAGDLACCNASNLGYNCVVNSGCAVLGLQVFIDLAWSLYRFSGCASGGFGDSLWGRSFVVVRIVGVIGNDISLALDRLL